MGLGDGHRPSAMDNVNVHGMPGMPGIESARIPCTYNATRCHTALPALRDPSCTAESAHAQRSGSGTGRHPHAVAIRHAPSSMQRAYQYKYVGMYIQS
jgi:hypothetical protein